MRIQFDANQEFQWEAINAVMDVFEGQPLAGGSSELRLEAAPGEMLTELGVANRLLLSDDALLDNVRAMQARNGIELTPNLQGRNFSVEMETGTGKTYVYLRTLYELNVRYGFKKFIIVVPSVAIREGALSSLRLTGDHFRELYGNIPMESRVYSSAQVSALRQFASSNQMQVLVMNIDAFNKDAAVIRKENDRLSGRRPLEFVQAASPIVVIDEPQNMETETAKAAIESLNPLFTLRYSATHRHLYNLLYRLDPVRAYDLRLVKRIEVDSVIEESDFNRPYILVESITAKGGKISAALRIDVKGASGPVRKVITVSKNGADLFDLSGGRELYRGYVVGGIDAGAGCIVFENDVILSTGETHGGREDERMRIQVRETIREHFEKELKIQKLPEGQRIKVLSLLFIDRVANYAEDDGKIRRWFVEAYEELAAMTRYQTLQPLPVEKVHGGYFAQDRGKPRDSSEARSTKADDEAYQLIMKDKERLLYQSEPLRFIFSHSALREGWDNPNVFQICTLNESRSEMRKRQEIGRGLRLPVRENGERCLDSNYNRLTVIANESYDQFARALQTEIEQECGVSFAGRVENKRERKAIILKKGWQLNPEFQALWDRIKHRTRYAVSYSSEDLVRRAAGTLRSLPPVTPPRFRVEKGELVATREGLAAEARASYTPRDSEYHVPIPDFIGYLQRETELTRITLARILIESGRLSDAPRNPQQFLDQALSAIRHTLHALMVEHIEYERIAGAEYEMRRFEEQELESYLNRTLTVDHSIYDAIEFDSEIERQFAETLDRRTDISLFVKLPRWFTVETPLGTYNPDWAIVKEGDDRVYLVRETKGTQDFLNLRETERQKIACGERHFQTLGVDYKWVRNANEV